MKHYLMGALAVAATLAFAGQVVAAEIDMTKITCKDVEQWMRPGRRQSACG